LILGKIFLCHWLKLVSLIYHLKTQFLSKPLSINFNLFHTIIDHS
jgi:hypothetical protein